MSNQNKNSASTKGFTLIEVLVGIVILALISLSFYSLINFTLKTIWEAKAKITATQLANQKIEMARNLSYQAVGTQNGIPFGTIPNTETVLRNNIEYIVNTQVIYIDDEFDGVLDGEPNDTLNTDYKKVRVEVSWNYRLQHKPVILITNIVPPGLESSVGGGTLKILVYNASGQPVSQANVFIQNTDLDPNININTLTDDQGFVILPGSPESIENYQITATKNNYSTDQTRNSTTELPSPEKPHASIFEDQTTNISFSIDLLSNLNLVIQNENEINLSNIELNIQGEKTIGFDAEELPVYKFNQNYFSNYLGQIILNNIEWDTYNFIMPTNAVYNISETVPIQPLNLLQNTTTAVLITLVPKAQHSALIIVKDINEQPLPDAQVHFYNYSKGLDQTIITDESGQAFFTPWQNTTSTLDIIKTGFENFLDEFEIDGYHIESIVLTEQ